jgi:hypothetical protein
MPKKNKNYIKINKKARANIRGIRLHKDAEPTFNEPMFKGKP